ncbi:MAG: N-6 DNA methylase [Bacteroidales bacterium]|nr:N-6 DNA methylase [Bacteroidales bacterium]
MKTISGYNEIKKSGATFTSPLLSNFLASRIIKYISVNGVLKVDDPACGDGALLTAISEKLTEKKIHFELSGSDTSKEYIEKTIRRIEKTFPTIKANIKLKDYIQDRIGTLFNGYACNDIIIANPPYVRTQVLGAEKAQEIAKLYKLKGKIDLYFPFLINMTESLREGGILGVITSNRYLTTKSGAEIRQYLLNNYDVLEIIDLGDTKLFDAAVLPAIFIGRKNPNKEHYDNTAIFKKIYENTTNKKTKLSANSVFDILNSNLSGLYQVDNKKFDYSVGRFQRPLVASEIWQMNTTEETFFIDTINRNKAFSVVDKFKVRVGVKSCADEVFFYDKWKNDEGMPEQDFFREIISQEDITKWTIAKKLKKVIYPHIEINGKKSVLDINFFPHAKAFFLKHKTRLEARTYLINTKRKWYEYWVPQNPKMWEYPKIVFADISVEPRFAIDKTGAIVNGNCYWLAATNEEEENLLYLIVGVANSKVMERYHDLCFNNKLYNGRRRYLSQYVEKYPMPNPKCLYSIRIIEIVKELYSGNKCKKELINYERLIDSLVERAFGLRIE